MSENEKAIDKQLRSPRYPILTIDEAIDKVRLVYREDKRALTPFEAVIGHMGYTAKKKGGRSARAVSTLKQYGLLEERMGQYRVSDLAFKLLEMPEDSPERAQLVREAAVRPPIFRKVLQHYSGELPSDAALRSHLIFQEKFNPESVREFIRVLRGTINIANPSPEDYTGGEESEGAEPPPSGAMPMQATPPRASQGQGQGVSPPPPLPPPAGHHIPPLAEGESVLAFKISRDSEARVIFKGQVTQEAIEKLSALLDLSKDAYPTKAELEQPRRAIWHNKDHDQPVTVIGEAGEHDGRRYVRIEGSDTGVPEDELEYSKGAA